MQPDHLKQMDLLREMGFGGACIHARTGLETEYLGPDFLSLVKAAVRKAQRSDSYILLYDEDRWPSGFAGGLVTRDPEFRQRRLVWTRKTELPEAKLIGRYVVELTPDSRLASYRFATNGETGTWNAWIQIAEQKAWHNNQSYVDTLNPAAIERFIETTHETYLRAVGKDFGKCIPAIFTDEPQFTPKGAFKKATDKNDLMMPFTDDFLATYERAYGQKLEQYLPELFWELPEGKSSVARYRYHDHVAERFAQAFSATIGKWCEAHNIALTGHMMAEDPLTGQSRYVGDAMRSLQYFQIPGIDMLSDKLEFMTAKQAQSAARQAGRKAVLSELYGVTGWHFDFAGHKRQGDWQAALGVTLRVPHLAWVSMAGESKRDYPAAIGWQSPWFREYPMVEDHFARVNMALTRGNAVVRVGVIHPIESYWLAEGPLDQTKAERDQQDKAAGEFCEWMLYNQQDFDYICEASLPSQTRHLRYDVVIVPNLATIRSSTLDYLEKVGTVIFAGRVPALVDGMPSDRAAKMASAKQQVDWSAAPLIAALEPFREIKVTPEGKALYQLRQDGSQRFLFVCNADRYQALGQTRIQIKGDWDLTELDTMTGRMRRVASEHKDGMTILNWTMPAHASVLLQLKPGWKPGGWAPSETQWAKGGALAEAVPVTLSEPNVLLLDQAQWCWNDGPWQPREEILRIDDALRKTLNIPARRGSMAQPWTDTNAPAVLGTIQLKFTVDSEVPVPKSFLALEESAGAKIMLDGKPVKAKPAGEWVDPCLQKLTLPAITAGDHELIVALPYTRRTNLEWHYLLGDFGVRVQGQEATLTEPVRSLRPGSWVEQGLPFYAGNVTYHFQVNGQAKRSLLSIPEFKAPLLKVSVDGKPAGRIAFAPFELELGKLKSGLHKVDVTAYGNRANAFGIVHHVNQDLPWYGPGAWRVSGKDWTYPYNLRAMGIINAPMVKFAEGNL